MTSLWLLNIWIFHLVNIESRRCLDIDRREMSSTSDCFRVAILIISTSLFNSRASKASIGDDDSLVDPSFDILRSDPFKLVKVKLISDQPDSIKTETLTITDQLSIDLLITTGGTGLHPHDHTPDVNHSTYLEIVFKILSLWWWWWWWWFWLIDSTGHRTSPDSKNHWDQSCLDLKLTSKYNLW